MPIKKNLKEKGECIAILNKKVILKANIAMFLKNEYILGKRKEARNIK